MIKIEDELINTVVLEGKLVDEDIIDAQMGIVTEIMTSDHNKLMNRNLSDQHSIEAISGLEEALAANKDKNYVHIQRAAAKVWYIQHNLNKMPSVVVQDSAGNTVIGEINYESENVVVLKFNGSFSGKAYLN